MNYNPYFANPYMAQNPNYGNQYQQAQSNQTSFIGVQNEQEARTKHGWKKFGENKKKIKINTAQSLVYVKHEGFLIFY